MSPQTTTPTLHEIHADDAREHTPLPHDVSTQAIPVVIPEGAAPVVTVHGPVDGRQAEILTDVRWRSSAACTGWPRTAAGGCSRSGSTPGAASPTDGTRTTCGPPAGSARTTPGVWRRWPPACRTAAWRSPAPWIGR